MTERRGRVERITLDRWSAMDTRFLVALATNPLPPRAMQVLLLAAARVNRIGHAEFQKDELRTLLGVPATRISEALTALRSAKYAAPESGPQCIVIHRKYIQQGRQSASGVCQFHGIT